MSLIRIGLLILMLAIGAGAEVPSGLAIRNARVVTVSGGVLPKATVLIRDGLIEAVGADLAIPADSWLIEGEGLTVYPGLVDALSTLGQDGRPTGLPAAPAPPAMPARGPEDRPRTFSWERVADKLRANDPRVESARGLGFTSAMTFPTTGIFAGQGAVMNLGDARPSRLVVQASAGQYVSFLLGGRGSGGGFPSSLMGVIAYIRQCYLDLEHYKQSKAAYERDPKGRTRPEYDRALEGLAESPRLLFPAVSLSEIDRVLRFTQELKQPAVLYGLHEGFRATELLKAAGLPVIVSTKWPTRSADADPEQVETARALETRAKAASTPGTLAKSGVKFAFSSDGQSAAEMLRGVRKAMQMGLSEADALRALTLSPAEIFGVADRMGSIEKGKIANLVVTRGDLLGERPRIEYVIVDGVKYLPPVPPATPAAKEMTR